MQEIRRSLHGRPFACYMHQGEEKEDLWVGKKQSMVLRATTQAEGATEDAIGDVALPEYCAGCGVRMQTENPSLPG